jgi:hypothetical protein
MGVKSIIAEEGGIVVEVNASSGMTESFHATNEDHAMVGLVLDEDETVVNKKQRPTGSTHHGVVAIVAVGSVHDLG